ncbi:hypothetical protein LOK49_LG11G00807 [Camellia lanceoleosa]|uniref:Uncharacterized protein n=1 Tax=Camellia lanceoleosa TaxID=1840588 RepID=A0ACC0FYB0_9ERIC|nr:hypothetical protein LOK49_LG11G00807 [Camellia lanceoleosa]
MTPLVLGPTELPSINGSNKKLKEEWSCALCHKKLKAEDVKQSNNLALQIGAHSKEVMNDHRKGKKHVGWLQELHKNVAAQTEKAHEKEKEDPYVVVKDEKEEETRNNVGRATDGDYVAMENHNAVAKGMQLVLASIENILKG